MKVVAYYIVSESDKRKQRRELAPQRKAVAEHAGGKVVAEYTEVLDDKTRDWSKLREALEFAKSASANLTIGHIGHFSQNAGFTSLLTATDVPFHACDKPHLNRETLRVLAIEAEQQSLERSRKVKDALAAKKKAGAKLGSARPGHWKGREHLRGWKKGAENSAKLRTKRMDAAYAPLLPIIRKMAEEAPAIRKKLRKERDVKVKTIEAEFDPKIDAAGNRSDRVKSLTKAKEAAIQAAKDAAVYPTYEKIAEHLNSLGHKTTVNSEFTGMLIWRLLKRHPEPESVSKPKRKRKATT